MQSENRPEQSEAVFAFGARHGQQAQPPPVQKALQAQALQVTHAEERTVNLILQLATKLVDRTMADFSALQADVANAVALASDASNKIDAALPAIINAEAYRTRAETAEAELANVQSQLDALHAALAPAVQAISEKVSALPAA